MDNVRSGRGAVRARHWLNEERVRNYSWLIVLIYSTVFVVWAGLSLPSLVDPSGKPFGYDFMAFWSAARLALAGDPAGAFDERTISAAQHLAVPFLPNIWFPWHYPPTFLLVVAPLGLLPYPAALALFVVGTGAFWAGLVGQILTDRRAWIVAAATPAGLINLLDGQNGFLTAALAGFALIWLERRPIVAGILIGLLAIKPQLAILFPLALLAEGRWRSIAAAALTVLMLCVLSLAAFGGETWAAFLTHLPVSQAMANAGALPWGMMPTPFVFARSAGASVTAAWVLQAVVALSAAFCVWRAWRNPAAPFEAKAATLIAGSLLISPFLFYYELLWAALAVGWLTKLALGDGFRRGERTIFFLAWFAAILITPVYLLISVQPGFFAVLLLLVAATRRAAPPTAAERRFLRQAVDALRSARWITRERLMRWGIGFMLMSLALLAQHIVNHTTVGLTDGRGNELANDFIDFWSSAHLAAAGETQRAYDPAQFQAFEAAVVGGPSSSYKIWRYPPYAILFWLPLALFPFIPALILWTTLGAVACFALLRRLVDWRAAAVATLGAPAAFLNVLSGQNGYYTAAFLAGGLMILERRPILAGISFGCLAYKPQMALLLPVALAASGKWRTIAAAAATAVVLVLAGFVLFGTASWEELLKNLPIQRQMLEFGGNWWHRILSVFVALRLIGAALPVAYAGQAISAALALVAVAMVWRSRAPIETKAATIAVATFLATPYAWDYDAVLLIFAAAWLGREGLSTGFLPWERIAIVALLVSPLLTMVTAKLAHAQLAPAVLWFVLLVLVRRGREYRLGAATPAGERYSVPAFGRIGQTGE